MTSKDTRRTCSLGPLPTERVFPRPCYDSAIVLAILYEPSINGAPARGLSMRDESSLSVHRSSWALPLDHNGEDRHLPPFVAYLQPHLKADHFTIADFSSNFSLRFEDWEYTVSIFERTSGGATKLRLPLEKISNSLGHTLALALLHVVPNAKEAKRKPSRGNLLSTSNAGLIPI
jgi:hypothetical protein